MIRGADRETCAWCGLELSQGFVTDSFGFSEFVLCDDCVASGEVFAAFARYREAKAMIVQTVLNAFAPLGSSRVMSFRCVRRWRASGHREPLAVCLSHESRCV